MTHQFYVQGDKLYPSSRKCPVQVIPFKQNIDLGNFDSSYNDAINLGKDIDEDSPDLDNNLNLSSQQNNYEEIPNLEELIKLVVNQTMCSEVAARRALISSKGDVIESILKVTS